jgi:fructokinase
VITVCGEALVDLVSTDGWHFTAHAGGSPANVAVGLARLGAPASLLARLSKDPFGRLVRAHLLDNGVDGRDLVEATEATTLAIATVDAAGSATYEFYVEGTADWQWTDDELPDLLPDDVDAIHTGSIVLELAPGAARVEALLGREHERGEVTVSYDPNVRLGRRRSRSDGLAAVERVVALADVVKVSSDDLDWLLPDVACEDVACRWLGLGPALVVVTLGAAGALALGRGAEEVRISPRQIDVVDTVGAGDAFTSGLLAGLAERRLLGGAASERLRGVDAGQLAAVVEYAALVATLTCTRPGANPPTRQEVEAWLSA